MTRAEALAAVKALAASILEPDAETAAARLLERIAAREDAAELRSALALVGADVVLQEARG